MEGTDLTGAILDGRYRVIEPISEGAMGVVYRAERLKLGRIVAIKVLHDELPTELSSRKRFEIEAMAMAKLEHPHCAAVIDVGVHDDKPFVVMDFVSGNNLRDVIEAGPLPRQRAIEIMRQVLAGLAHAHEHGIIHRDIKPANIVLSQKAGLGDHVKILDFGLARLSDATTNITTGIVVGTPSYMAPEQIRGVVIDHRADLYACGVLLFELLTGKKPFVSQNDDPVEVCSLHLKKPPPTLASMQPGIELDDLEPIVAKALAKKADDRYSTAGEFAGALEQLAAHRSAPVSAPVPVPIGAVISETGWAVPPEARSSMYPAPAGDAAASAPVVAPIVSAAPAPVQPSVVPPSAPVIAAAPIVGSGPNPAASKLPPPFRTATPAAGSPIAPSPVGAPSAPAAPSAAVATPAAGSPIVGAPAPYAAAPSAPIAPYAMAPSAPVAAAAPSATSHVPPSSPVVAAAPIVPGAFNTPHAGSPVAAAALASPNTPLAGSPVAAGVAVAAPSFVPPSSPVVAAAPIVDSAPAVAPPPEKRGLPTDFDLSTALPRPQVDVPPEPEPSAALPADVVADVSTRTGTMLGIPTAHSTQTRLAEDTVPSGPPPAAGQDTVLSGPPPEAARDSKATVAFLGAVPAGPSPLAARDAPAVGEAAAVAMPRPARQLTKQQLAIGVGGALGVILLIALIVGARGGSSATAAKPTVDAAVATAPPPPDPDTKAADEQVARANDLLSSGHQQEALDHILATRKVFPKDARFAYLAGKIYFERQWWTVGLKQFRDVLALDPSYRTNDELIKIVLKAFITPADYPSELGKFLRTDIGEPAKPYLQETAASHPRAGIRARAKAELDRMR